MFTYEVLIRFASPFAPGFTDDVLGAIEKAVAFYNSRSALSTRNKKELSEYSVVNLRTLRLVLRSEIDLPFPSKALQLFSRYLVDPSTEGTLSKYVYARQLFTMDATSLAEQKTEKRVLVAEEHLNTDRVRAISLLLTASQEKIRFIIANLEEETTK